MRDFAPVPLLINHAVRLSSARTLRKSRSAAPGTTAACQVAPPSSVRRYAPPAPLAQTTAGFTALTPRKDAVVPLDCATHLCGNDGGNDGGNVGGNVWPAALEAGEA
jgi:hypothetical protein